jgi:PEP-CTERM motif
MGWTQIAMGIYMNDADGLRVVADTDTETPGGTGEFTSFIDRTSAEGNRVLLGGRVNHLHDAIFLAVGNDLHRIIGRGDVLDGQTVDFVNFMTDSLSGDQIALAVTFAGSREAVYLVSVPEPGTGGLVFAGVLAIAAARRRSRAAAAPR